MERVDRHGLNIKGLRKASGDTINYGPYSGSYSELFYNKRTGEVWVVYHYSIGMNSYTRYHDEDIIKICNTQDHMTMQDIADAIYYTVNGLAW